MTVPAVAVPRLPAVALAALLGAMVSLGVMAAAGTSGSRLVPARPFGISVPAGWKSVPPASRPAHAMAALRSPDGRAVIAIRPSAPVHATGAALARSLATQLRGRFPGFRPVSARFVTLRGGRAFVYTFVHDHAVQLIALTAVRGQAYAIDATAPGAAPAQARQIAAAVRSFGP